MPLRSPKMYFCIFGFHRLVWWPKCTPASSSSFMVSVAMVRRSFPSWFGWPPAASGRPPERGAGTSPGPTRPTGTEARYRAWLGRVLGVDSNVLLAEVGCPHRVLAPAQAQVDRDRVARPTHHLVDPVHPGPGPQHSPLDQRLAA